MGHDPVIRHRVVGRSGGKPPYPRLMSMQVHGAGAAKSVRSQSGGLDESDLMHKFRVM